MSPGRSKGWRDPEGGRSDELTSVSEVVRGILGRREFARGVAVGLLARTWPEVVGERLAAETRPSKLEAGTLVVSAASGPWGTQARFLAEEIRTRANEALGKEMVKQVRVVVDPDGIGPSKPL